MRSQILAFFAASLVAVSALPSLKPRQDTSNPDWVNDKNGNLLITFSDDKIQIGTLPIDTIIGNLSQVCSTHGQCDTSDVEFKAQLVAGGRDGSVDDITVTMGPSGDYPTWIHNGLIEALSAAIKAAAKCEDVTNTPTCPNPAVFCPSKPFTVNECTVPKYWGVNYQNKDAHNAAPPFIGADFDMKVDGDGFCETFTTIGSAVAGAVNGAAGGIFTLLGLACQK